MVHLVLQITYCSQFIAQIGCLLQRYSARMAIFTVAQHDWLGIFDREGLHARRLEFDFSARCNDAR